MKRKDRRTIWTKNPGRCGDLAAIVRWPLVEVRLYNIFPIVVHLSQES